MRGTGWQSENLFCVDGKRVVYLFLVLIIGAGLIVNVVFKDHFGRARPRDVTDLAVRRSSRRRLS